MQEVSSLHILLNILFVYQCLFGAYHPLQESHKLFVLFHVHNEGNVFVSIIITSFIFKY